MFAGMTAVPGSHHALRTKRSRRPYLSRRIGQRCAGTDVRMQRWLIDAAAEPSSVIYIIQYPYWVPNCVRMNGFGIECSGLVVMIERIFYIYRPGPCIFFLFKQDNKNIHIVQ